MILNSERLTLTEFSVEDAPFFYNLVNDPDWIKYIGDRNVKTISDAEKYLADKIISSYKENGFGFYIVRLKEENTPIGMCGLIKRDWMHYIDIGYAFLAQFREKGYALEAGFAIKKYAKEQLKINQLAAITDLNNTRSSNLLLKLGFEFKKVISYSGEESKCNLYLEK